MYKIVLYSKVGLLDIFFLSDRTQLIGLVRLLHLFKESMKKLNLILQPESKIPTTLLEVGLFHEERKKKNLLKFPDNEAST